MHPTCHTLLSTLSLITTAAAPLYAEESGIDLNQLIRPYSSQQIVELDLNEPFTFKLRSGAERTLRILAIREHRDSVVNLMRRAEVRAEIDGRPLDLVCMPYVMPTEVAGLRVQVDSTSGWGNTAKTARLSIWDAADPIVNTRHFRYPLRHHHLFSHGTQCYNEPVHLGLGDDDPGGNHFYHDYGFDTAGFEGRDEVISATDGQIVLFWPSREDLCSVVVRHPDGLFWEYAHLSSVEPDIVLNASVRQGQKIGLLGRTGPSGNFAHLHVGSYEARSHIAADRPNRGLNLYPWLITAYQARHPKGLFAVARPHQIAMAGEKVTLDGSCSLAWGGARIVEWQWAFPDGQTVRQSKVEKVFDKPGAHVAALWVKDSQGNEDVDFCQIKVYSKLNPEKGMPHLFMTCSPTENIRPNQPVTFRLWFQGGDSGPITIEFDDGTKVTNYPSYAELSHRFTPAGIHIVTARCEADGKPITQKMKVIVTPALQPPLTGTSPE
ncbi:MAG: peptidoglycan DD-metalloendopeptidase family protein [Phycisphaerae bacterium]|nr:peptidoglycan DD-metalloendopeptidase family protein [Phycisphaerae bacterium]